MIQSDFFEHCISAALDVPAETLPERHSWVCRNLAEVTLMASVAGYDVNIVDSVIADTDFEYADPRFCERLHQLRSIVGDTLPPYPRGRAICVDELGSLSSAELQAAKAISIFADALFNTAIPHQLEISMLEGDGEVAITELRNLRPAASKHNPVFVRRPDIAPHLVWRAWMTLPQRGPAIVVVDQRLSPAKLAIWWGIHNGSHLDHLSQFSSEHIAPIEFGRGLLVAESWAMCAEMLAAAEGLIKGDAITMSVVRTGLIERLGRLPLPPSASFSPSYQLAIRTPSVEFCALPTLSKAYVVGAIALLGNGFKNSFIPEHMAIEARRRWDHAAQQSASVERLLLSAMQLAGEL